jgi:hypothetical protein
MSDERTPWASPGAPGPSGQPLPQYGEYAPPGWVSPNATAWPPPTQGWTPPPQPGLIPLRPLTLGDILGAAFRVMRRNPRPTFGFALLMSLLTTVVAGGIVGLAAWASFSRLSMAGSDDVPTLTAGGALVIVLAAIVAIIVQLALSAIPQGVIALEVSRGTLGERLRLGELWRRARGRIGALLGWTLLIGGALVVLIVIAALAIVPLATAGGVGGAVGAVAISLVVGAGLVVLSVWLGTKLEFVPSLLLIERLSLRDAIRRSWALTRGSFWRIFGITLLVNVIVQVAAQIVTTPITLIGSLFGSLVNPNQSAGGLPTATIVVAIVSFVVGVLVSAVTLVAQAAVPALLYLDMRMRREGLDLDLQRYAEAKAAGGTPPDPFG